MRIATLLSIVLLAGGGSALVMPRLRAANFLAAFWTAPAGAGAADESQPSASESAPRVVACAAGQIDVEGGTIPLSPTCTGRIERIAVVEGQAVAKGDPLIVVESKEAALRVEQAEAVFNQAEILLEQSRQSAKEHPLSLSQQEQAIVAARARLSAQSNLYRKLDSLRQSGAASEENRQAAADKLIEAEAQLKAEEAKLNQLRLAEPSRAVRLGEASVRAARAQLLLARQSLEEHTLRAPAGGTILRLFVNAGQLVGPGAGPPAMWFQPNGRLIVRCEIEQEFAGRVRPGMPALVTTDGEAGDAVSGVVERLAPWVAPRRTFLNENAELRELPTIECIVAFDPAPGRWRVGQRVRVSFREP